jgi:hypothetical protein
MIKTEILSQLENAKNNFILVLASTSLFSDERTYSILDESECNFGTYSISFNQVSNLMRKKYDRNIACKEFVNMGLRILIKETFELIKDYSIETQQEQLLKSQNWYQFARCIRNCLSHNFKFQFHNETGKILYKLPIYWKNKIIDISLDNTPLQLSFFGYIEAWELFDEMNLFVKNTLE